MKEREILIEMNNILTLMQKKSIYLNIHNIIYILLDKNLTKINLIEKYNNTSIDLYMKLYNLYKIYKKNIDDLKNSGINILLCELLYKFCIYLYTNKIIINDIIEFKEFNELKSFISSRTRRTIKESFSIISRKILMTKFLNFINSNKNKDFTMEIVNIDNYMYYIFGLFNYNIFNYGLNNKQILDRDYIEIVKPSSFSLVFKPNLYDIETFTNINEILINIDSIINYIKNLVNQINNKIYKKSTISYITLPQYEGICWFISMLNCLTYSDMNKNLLIKKLEKTPTINKKNKFNRFIYYIINNITKDYKSYNSYFIYSNCILLSKLKSEPIKIIKTLLYEEATKIDKTELYYLSILKTICNMIDDEYFNINKKIPSNILQDIIIKITLDNYFIFTLIYNILNEDYNINNIISKSIIENYTIEQRKIILAKHIYNNKLLPILNDPKKLLNNNDDGNDYGIFPMYSNILSYFYNLLEINNNYYYCYKLNEEIHIRKNMYFNYVDNPDVIIIETCNYKLDYINYEDTTLNGLFDIGEDIINFNGNQYKLDYMTHGSKDDISCPDCGHSISAIHYKNEEYIYDSRFHNYVILCGINNINIPCPLIKQQWTDKIKTNSCYKVEKCGVIDIPMTTINSIDIYAHTTMCYSYNTSIIYGYVKIDK